MTRWREVAALLVILAVAAGIGQTGFGNSLLRGAGLFKTSSNYTSLAFLRPQLLPGQLKSKRANVGISFVIHNAASIHRYYQWSVLLVRGDGALQVDAGIARVPPGHGAAITRSVGISCTQGRIRIVVRIARPAESIGAWTACWTPRN
jgi:hypothetical protein